MSPTGLYQKYQAAQSLQDALAKLAVQDSRIVRVLAGGTDLMLQLHERQLSADVLVDVSCLEELRGVRLEPGRVVIGAATPFVEIIHSPLVRQHAFLLTEAARQIGAAQIQNMGTLGGNIANASPAADSIPCLYALEAEVVVCSLAGERIIPIAKFHQGYRKIDLQPGELIVEIRFPTRQADSGAAFVKFGLRQSQAISVVNVAVQLRLSNGLIEDSKVALGAVAPTIIRSLSVEQVLSGQIPSEELFELAAEAARKDARPIDDIRGSSAFRRHLVGVGTVRALNVALKRASSTLAE